MGHGCSVKVCLRASRNLRWVWRLLALVCLSGWFGWCAAAAPLRVATFRCDVTPWPGEPLVWATKLVKVEDPLLAKGIVLEDGTNRYVLCALDWCLLCNDSQALLPPGARRRRRDRPGARRRPMHPSACRAVRRRRGAPIAGCRAQPPAAP